MIIKRTFIIRDRYGQQRTQTFDIDIPIEEEATIIAEVDPY